MLLFGTATIVLAQQAPVACDDKVSLDLMSQARWAELQKYLAELSAKAVASGAPTADLVCIQTRLAGILGQMERLPEAIGLLEQTAAYSIGKLGANHRASLDAKLHLATLYSRQGRYDQAIPAYRSLLPEYEKRYGSNSLSVATILRNISTSLHWLGNFADALPNDVRVLQIMEGLRPGAGSCLSLENCRGMLGAAHQHLAASLNRVGRAPEALPHALKGVELQRESRGENHPQTLDAHLTHASVLNALKRRDEARAIQLQAMQSAKQMLGDAHPLTRKAVGDYAASSQTVEEVRGAIEVDTRRLVLIKEKLGSDHPDVFLTVINLVERHMMLNQLDQALALAESTVTAMVGRADTLAFDDRTADAWNNSQARLTNAYIFLLARNNRIWDAFLFSEFLKHRKLSLALDARLTPTTSPAIAQEIKASSRKLSLVDQRISLARSLGQNVTQLNDERSQEFLNWKRLAARPADAVPSTKAWPDWGRKLLIPGDTVVSYRFVGRSLYAFVVNSKNISLDMVDGQDRVRPSIEAYRLAMRHQAIQAGKPASPLPVWRLSNGGYQYSVQSPAIDAQAVTDLNEILRSLSVWLLKVVTPKLGTQTRLLISVDQNLGHLPFDALPLGDGLLGDRYTVGILPSFALYDTLLSRQSAYSKIQRQPMLAVGGAHYAKFEKISPWLTVQRERESTPMPMDTKILWQAVQRDRSKLPFALSQLSNGLVDLPGSLLEAETIARLFDADKNTNAVLLTGERASEDSINKLADSGQLARFRILHFASHGYLSDDEPGLSAIVLAQVNRASGTDGYLTSAELAGMTLQSDLVVVSACDSGASEKIFGGGAMGLSFALFQAGTVASLLTLWPVPDQDSRRFMEQFYTQLRTVGLPFEALQKTKAWAKQNKISNHVIQGFVLWGI